MKSVSPTIKKFIKSLAKKAFVRVVAKKTKNGWIKL